MKAIFFDRDDTLIKDSGYMFKLEDLEFFKDTIPTLKTLQSKGYILFIVTNQSGIGRGYYSEDQMHAFNENMLSALKSEGIEFKDLAFCPHSPEEKCDCRKPSPKLINELCQRHNIDPKLSYMIGDKTSDFEAGKNAGMQSIRVSPGEISSIIDKIS